MDSPDRIELDFTATAPGQKLVGDISYLQTVKAGSIYGDRDRLATRMAVGWHLAKRMRTSLVTDALATAIGHGRLKPNAIFHSGRDTQDTSTEFTDSARRNTFGPAWGGLGFAGTTRPRNRSGGLFVDGVAGCLLGAGGAGQQVVEGVSFFGGEGAEQAVLDAAEPGVGESEFVLAFG
jgi:transposase InsO family protein